MNCLSILSIATLIFYFFNNINVEGKNSRIIGGRPTKPRQIKYLVGIFRNGNYICGGGIIGQKYIITAAHCVVESMTNVLKTGKFKIAAGSDNLNVITPSTIEVAVKKYFVPTIYNGSFWSGLYPKGDVAVLELTRNLNLTDKNLQKLELPSDVGILAPNDNIYKRVPAETAGFGKDNFTYYTDKNGQQQFIWKSSRQLLHAKVQIIDRIICQKSYSGNIWNTTICGRMQNYLNGTHQGLCKGDSGSPLVQNGTIVIEVISASSKSCNDNLRPGIYTKIASFITFIKNAVHGITDDMRVQAL